ncbi:MAG: hopanoid biosynthesis-associated protein HpnK [Armatimonadota bacterium]|nr:hopanoid biosynthesis-associated protein HpnK [bacterium]
MSRLLIINADDFGSSEAINAAVAQAHRFGTLTSASLMVTGNAVREAVSIARDLPDLAVGLHLALSNAKSILPQEVIPDLVNAESRFSDDPIACAWHYYFSRRAKAQLAAEIEAQFEAFAQTGLHLSHVDGHQHLHAHPFVMPVVMKMANRYDAKGIRAPRDPFFTNLGVDRTHIGSKIVTALGHGYLSTVYRRALRGSGLATCNLSIGAMMSGAMNVDYVTLMLEKIHARSVEVFFHPSISDCVRQGPNTGDLQTLLNPEFREFVKSAGFTLSTYADISKPEARK